MNPSLSPQPAPPGAGLPSLELALARRMFALKRLLGNPDSFTAQFRRERQSIRTLCDSSPSQLRAQPVLIPRLPGLEDSSRHWSLWMTLDHLRITNEAFARIITALTAGRLPAGGVSTAAVKPDPAVTATVDPAYERSCDSLLVAAAAPELKTAQRFAHPWFGPLDAAGWLALAALHMGIHRAQIQRILRGLHP